MKAKNQIFEINLTLVSFLPYETEKKSQEGRKSGECPCNYVITEDPGIVVDSLVFSGTVVVVPLTLQEATFFLTGCFWAGVMASGGLKGQKCAQGSWGVGTEREVHSMLFLCKWECFLPRTKGGWFRVPSNICHLSTRHYFYSSFSLFLRHTVL